MEAVLQTPIPFDERHLAKRFRRGEASAFDEVVERHRERVYAIARRMLGNHADADEAAQLTFVRAWRARATFRGEARIGSWLVRIAMRTASSLRAERAREVPLEAGRADAALADDPTARIDRKTLREAVRAAIERLPERQREVVILKIYEDRTYREVGEVLELAEGTVKAHLHQAIGNLRRLLDRDGQEAKR